MSQEPIPTSFPSVQTIDKYLRSLDHLLIRKIQTCSHENGQHIATIVSHPLICTAAHANKYRRHESLHIIHPCQCKILLTTHFDAERQLEGPLIRIPSKSVRIPYEKWHAPEQLPTKPPPNLTDFSDSDSDTDELYLRM